MNRLPARTGLAWLKQGFTLFRTQPGILTTLVFANFLFTMLVASVPLLGLVLPVVLIPSFGIAIQQACHLIAEGQKVPPSVLLTGFRKDSFGPLCKMGLVYLLVFAALMLAVYPWINIEAMQASMKQMETTKQASFDSGSVMAIMVFALLSNLTLVALSFTPALTYWKKMPTFKAVFYSVAAVFGSARPMLVMLAYWLAIFWGLMMLIATVFGRSQLVVVMIMWLVLIASLILQCGIYAAYRQIIGTDQAD